MNFSLLKARELLVICFPLLLVAIGGWFFARWNTQRLADQSGPMRLRVGVWKRVAPSPYEVGVGFNMRFETTIHRIGEVTPGYQPYNDTKGESPLEQVEVAGIVEARVGNTWKTWRSVPLFCQLTDWKENTTNHNENRNLAFSIGLPTSAPSVQALRLRAVIKAKTPFISRQSSFIPRYVPLTTESIVLPIWESGRQWPYSRASRSSPAKLERVNAAPLYGPAPSLKTSNEWMKRCNIQVSWTAPKELADAANHQMYGVPFHAVLYSKNGRVWQLGQSGFSLKLGASSTFDSTAETLNCFGDYGLQLPDDAPADDLWVEFQTSPVNSWPVVVKAFVRAKWEMQPAHLLQVQGFDALPPLPNQKDSLILGVRCRLLSRKAPVNISTLGTPKEMGSKGNWVRPEVEGNRYGAENIAYWGSYWYWSAGNIVPPGQKMETSFSLWGTRGGVQLKDGSLLLPVLYAWKKGDPFKKVNVYTRIGVQGDGLMTVHVVLSAQKLKEMVQRQISTQQ